MPKVSLATVHKTAASSRASRVIPAGPAVAIPTATSSSKSKSNVKVIDKEKESAATVHKKRGRGAKNLKTAKKAVPKADKAAKDTKTKTAITSKTKATKKGRKGKAVAEDDPDVEYEVERIVESKINKAGVVTKYLVQWKGYGQEDRTWEPKSNLANAQDAIDTFEAADPAGSEEASGDDDEDVEIPVKKRK